MNFDFLQVVTVFGTFVCVLGVIACLYVGRTRFDQTSGEQRHISLGGARVPVLDFAKIVAFGALIALPAGAVFLANYHTFEGVHEVRGCASCHVMRPMVNDMMDPQSMTLSARHFKNRWIAENQCYHCHSDYGLSGDVEAKMTGFRHLARYTTRTFHEPIHARVRFDNKNCLNCHARTPKFEAVQSHKTVANKLASNQMICLNCHGQAHPTSLQRTPGSIDYARLMRATQ
jgi:cytochrome c nitrite reductase small subunit